MVDGSGGGVRVVRAGVSGCHSIDLLPRLCLLR